MLFSALPLVQVGAQPACSAREPARCTIRGRDSATDPDVVSPEQSDPAMESGDTSTVPAEALLVGANLPDEAPPAFSFSDREWLNYQQQLLDEADAVQDAILLRRMPQDSAARMIGRSYKVTDRLFRLLRFTCAYAHLKQSKKVDFGPGVLEFDGTRLFGRRNCTKGSSFHSGRLLLGVHRTSKAVGYRHVKTNYAKTFKP